MTAVFKPWSHRLMKTRSLNFKSFGILALIGWSALTVAQFAHSEPAKETPLSMVNALHTAFGEHHARAVHTKGMVLQGTFTPAPEARTLVAAPIFSGGTLPIIGRFSLFAGI